jgi:precorrin-4/cobalt-precorrin-4 C11-methyltransferase
MSEEDGRRPVLFVGAGPGDADLITVAGRRALDAADLVVYTGSLVPEEMLSSCRAHTRRVNSAGMELEEIVSLMVEAQGLGERVVRLHTGDPSLYGAMAEQLAALEEQGVPYRIIPGVTSAFAAAAALGLEYTLPGVSQSLILTRAAGRTPTPETEDLAALAAHRTGLAIYLSAGRAAKVSRDLSGAMGEDAPVAVVYRASWPDERILWTTAGELEEALSRADITRHALILAGPAVTARREGGPPPRSHLYGAAFADAYRKSRVEEE